ncbi:SapC family protein [Sphingomonas flavalba]|uniref:SapC family protein n=1 Tax=Sphingomonas flavalba TaxID=2559804 RepID=UPI0039DFB109
MASQPPANLPLFYKDLVPLSSNDHADWRTRPTDALPFLAIEHAVPIAVEEFIPCQRSFPIVFSSGENSVPLALMALNAGMNTMIGEDGRMSREAYVPAYIRRYPFMLARLRPDTDELSLCFDPTSNAVGPGEEGEPLFVDGQPSDATKSILQFCEGFEQAAAQTNAFMAELNESGLLMDGEVKIEQPEQEQPFVYRGFRMVDQDKLKDMRGDQLRKWSQNGMLPLLYAHLFSLGLVSDVFGRQVRMGRLPEMMGTSAA